MVVVLAEEVGEVNFEFDLVLMLKVVVPEVKVKVEAAFSLAKEGEKMPFLHCGETFFAVEEEKEEVAVVYYSDDIHIRKHFLQLGQKAVVVADAALDNGLVNS